MRDQVANEVFGTEVPGRRVAVTVKVDCVVRCTIDLHAIEIAPDPDYPDTVVVTLPPVRVSADFGEGAEAEYGRLRNSLLDGEKAAELRREMYAAARRKAADSFGEVSLLAFRDEPAREVEKLFRKQFPGREFTSAAVPYPGARKEASDDIRTSGVAGSCHGRLGRLRGKRERAGAAAGAGASWWAISCVTTRRQLGCRHESLKIES